MLFTITRDQYQRYGDIAGTCRQYILDKYPRLCSIVNTFSNYFGASNIDVYGNGFKQKSLLLTLLEQYDQNLVDNSMIFTEYLDETLPDASDRTGMMEKLSIYVYWPRVTVSNERNQSVEITDLYARVPIYPNGKLCDVFGLTRSSYPYEQFVSGYMHSHVQSIGSDPSSFKHPCLGTGPLVRTQATLMTDDNSELWDLFCVELDRYVHVESVAGVPYRYLDRIGASSSTMRILSLGGRRDLTLNPINQNPDLTNLFTQFFKYVIIQKKLKFAYEGTFLSAYSKIEWILMLSREFIKYYAMMKNMHRTDVTINRLIELNLIKEVKINNGILYTPSSTSSSSCVRFSNQHVLYFKGEDIRSHVALPTGTVDNMYYILDPVLALTFQDQCLNYLNIYEHEKNKNVITEESEVISRNSQDGDGSSQNNSGRNAFTNYPLGEKRIAISL